MITCKHIQMAYFEIFSPKYSTKSVLLKDSKIGDKNKIVFTKAPHMGTEPYYVSGATAKKYPKVSNGTIACREVPLSELEPIEYKDGCIHLV